MSQVPCLHPGFLPATPTNQGPFRLVSLAEASTADKSETSCFDTGSKDYKCQYFPEAVTCRQNLEVIYSSTQKVTALKSEMKSLEISKKFEAKFHYPEEDHHAQKDNTAKK